MAQTIEDLEELSWRGLSMPYIDRQLSFRHRIARTPLQGSRSRVASLGPDEPVITYTIPARDGIREDLYGGAVFSDIYPLFWAAMRDPSPGQLVDPQLGPLRAVPDNHSERGPGADLRDGIELQASFAVAPDVGQPDPPATVGASLSLASVQLSKIQNLITGAPEVPSVAANLLGQIAGGLALVRAQANFYATTITGVLQGIDQLEREIARSTDPNMWAALQALRDLYVTCQRMAGQGAKSRKVRQRKTVRDDTPKGVAQWLGISLSDFRGLNGSLISKTRIPAGTEVFTYG